MAERILVSDLFRNSRLALANRLRLLRRTRVDYVVLRISGSFPERTVQPRRRFPLSLLPWPSPPPSVESFDAALEHLAADPRVKGAVLSISGLSAGLATLSSLRQAISRFRESGKQAIAHLHDLTMGTYYLASACDVILAPESATFQATGLWAEALFLRETLAQVGIEADFEAIAEYKVSPDTFRRAEMTEPHREMLESILDSIYGEMVSAIAIRRGLTPDGIRDLLDAAPMTTLEACERGLLDDTCYEDELAGRLGSPEAPAHLLTWSQARKRLVWPMRWHSRRAIGVVSLEGLIVSGPSRQPPLPLPLPGPGRQAGSDTLIQQLRSAAQDKRLAGVILHVDSPGGSALASDLIWREVDRLRRLKPVVVFMSNQAASGGYYVSAAAQAIVAQPVTLTGSIGIWGGKFVTRGLFERIGANRQAVSRGQAAGLYSDTTPFSDQERAIVRADIGTGYIRFKERVAEGRGRTVDQVEVVARGRVWTGEQALTHGLVDELGDLKAAANKARDLAGLDPRRYVPLVNVTSPKQLLLPEAIASDGDLWLANLKGLLRGRTLALAPWSIRIRD